MRISWISLKPHPWIFFSLLVILVFVRNTQICITAVSICLAVYTNVLPHSKAWPQIAVFPCCFFRLNEMKFVIVSEGKDKGLFFMVISPFSIWWAAPWQRGESTNLFSKLSFADKECAGYSITELVETIGWKLLVTCSVKQLSRSYNFCFKEVIEDDFFIGLECNLRKCKVFDHKRWDYKKK